MKKLIVSIFALAAVVYSANAADFVTGTGKATLVAQVALTTTITGHDLGSGSFAGGELNFGIIGIGTASNIVSVNATTGARTSTNVGISNNNITPTAAGFKASGPLSSTYALTLPSSVDLTDGSNVITVTNFSTYSAGTLNASGDDYFSVGADLTVPANAIAGAYTGDFIIAVNYN